MLYVVLDLHYTPDERQECFQGTYEECEKYKAEQCTNSLSNEFMLKIVPSILK